MRVIILSIPLITLSACSTSVCLTTPASMKISDERVSSCEKEVKAAPDRRDFYQRYMHILLARGEYSKVVSLSRDIVVEDPSRTDALFYRAVGLRKLGHHQAALRDYQAYAKKRKNDPDPYYGMALCYEKLGEPKNAARAFQRYLKNERRSNHRKWKEKAKEKIALLLGRKRIAKRTKRKRIAPPPANTVVLPKKTPKPIATVSKPKPAPIKRVEDCNRFNTQIKKDPFNTKSYENFATCSLAKKDYQTTIKKIRIALRDNPDWHMGWLYLSRAYQGAGQSQQAKVAKEKACSGGISAACH